MARILIVDDEVRMRQLLELYLRPYGHTCLLADSAEQALQLVQTVPIDLGLLDVMMPEVDGWTLCQNIRQFADFPIIMVTARNQREDVLRGHEVGADDYLSKPIQEGELLARIELLVGKTQNQAIMFHGLRYDASSYRCDYEGKRVLLTKKEFQLVGKLLHSKNRVLSRERILESVWGYDQSLEPRTVDSHIRHVRENLRDVGFPIDRYLETIRGIGYRMTDYPE